LIDKNLHTASVEEICKNRFKQILDSEVNDGFTEFESFIGELTQDYVNQVSLEIEERLFEKGIKKAIIKRLFTIIVEGLQNVRLHGQNSKLGVKSSFFIILENNEQFDIYLGNLVLNENINKIQERIKQVNNLDKAGIKELYLNILTNGTISSKGGAGLGFITMSMKSKNKLTGYFEQIDQDISHYDLKVVIDKVVKG